MSLCDSVTSVTSKPPIISAASRGIGKKYFSNFSYSARWGNLLCAKKYHFVMYKDQLKFGAFWRVPIFANFI